MTDEEVWYWLGKAGIAWVRENVPGARIERHGRAVRHNQPELRDTEAVAFPKGGLQQARKAGFKIVNLRVTTRCTLCARHYVPYYEDDPCPATCPACSRHAAGMVASPAAI